ncbi:MAG: PASTA domain-containing protein [Bacteroidaceae bacterium]|jgi:beta-lactam-binding protein with PASTA domain|nr:PASTA domain-containing protein [Bacteroidaceae bacterium]
MTIREFFSFRENRFFWLNIIGMVVAVVLVVLCVLKGLDIYTHHGEAVTVPDVKGKSVLEARQILEKYELNCMVTDSDYVSTLPAGSILDYNPPAGQKVKRGRIIYLNINTLSVPLVNVPDVADNSSLRQAEARLLAAGFKISQVEQVDGEKDWVYGVKYNGQRLEIGERVPINSTLSLMVGSGEVAKDSLQTDENGLEINVSQKKEKQASGDDDWF